MSSRSWLSAIALAGVWAYGCAGGGSSPPPQHITVSVTPSSITVRTGDSQPFRAVVSGSTNQSVTWAVNDAPGGSPATGLISVSGLYTPPAQLPVPNQVRITATSAADASAKSTAQVTLANPIAVVNFVYPTTLVANAPFSVSVIGSSFISGAQALLGSASVTTTLVDSSHLTLSGTAPAAGVVNLTVVNPMPDGAPSIALPIAVTVVNQRAAVRFLEQSTFGPGDAQLAAVEIGGMENFLGAQFQAPVSTYPDIPPGKNDLGDLFPVFFQNALNTEANSDQLRQRVMFALNQIWVVSGNKVGQPEIYAPYLRVLMNDGFGNYRTLMEDVTLNPAMGIYLDMVNNAKPDVANGIHANENYARELLQLFTIGPNLLKPDGTPVIQNGAFVATYTQSDIQALARAFTGWTFPGPTNCAITFNNPLNGNGPMVPCDDNHDMDVKSILGVTLPAGQSAQHDLTQALDTIFMHNNLPPFVAKRFIQHLVTSNPSPAYVTRAATAFANGKFTSSNGTPFGGGTRGDMQALLAAILLDPDARRGDDPATENLLDGHLREPVLITTSVLRSFRATVNSNNTMVYLALYMGGEFLFYSPSVFNFFSPLYQIPLTQPPLGGPEFQVFTSANSLTRVDAVKSIFFSLESNTRIDLNPYLSLASNDAGTLVDAMNLQLLHATMSPAMRTALLDAVNAVPAADPATRVGTAAYLITSSPQYQVQR